MTSMTNEEFLIHLENHGVLALPGTCQTCDKMREKISDNGDIPFEPHHRASPNCESGGRDHCTCDICF